MGGYRGGAGPPGSAAASFTNILDLSEQDAAAIEKVLLASLDGMEKWAQVVAPRIADEVRRAKAKKPETNKPALLTVKAKDREKVRGFAMEEQAKIAEAREAEERRKREEEDRRWREQIRDQFRSVAGERRWFRHLGRVYSVSDGKADLLDAEGRLVERQDLHAFLGSVVLAAGGDIAAGIAALEFLESDPTPPPPPPPPRPQPRTFSPEELARRKAEVVWSLTIGARTDAEWRALSKEERARMPPGSEERRRWNEDATERARREMGPPEAGAPTAPVEQTAGTEGVSS